MPNSWFSCLEAPRGAGEGELASDEGPLDDELPEEEEAVLEAGAGVVVEVDPPLANGLNSCSSCRFGLVVELEASAFA